jgi:hypothetical protein
MIEKVIYIGYQPLTEKVKEDFYFQNLIEAGVEIEYWDLTDVFFSNLFEKKLKDNYIYNFNSFAQFEERLRLMDNSKTLFISNITFEYKVIRLYQILSKYKCKTSFFGRGALPFYSGSESTLEKLYAKFKKAIDLKILLRYLKNKYALYLKRKEKVAPHFIVFRAGRNGIQTVGCGSYIEESKSEVVDVNSFDYDKFIESKGSMKLVDSNYCVYLDEYLPFHPDFEMLGIKTVPHVEFYSKLNGLFKKIELLYNVEVVIAAHPKADKYREKDFFEGRKVFYGKTAELTLHADFVIAHCTTSMSFAVLNNKPILSLVSDSIKEVMPQYYQFIQNFSFTLNSKLVNVDKIEEGDLKLKEIDELKYEDYKYKFLTSKESENRLSSEIFIETIQRL